MISETHSLSKNINDVQDAIFCLNEIKTKKVTTKIFIQKILDRKYPECMRSINWRISLRILPFDSPETWIEFTKNSRKNFKILWENSFKDENVNNYFSGELDEDDLEKIYTKEFSYSLHLIKIDSRRTFQDVDLFRNEFTLDIIKRILYIWIIQSPERYYVQGMNEILGTIYYSLFPCLFRTSYKKELNLDHPSDFYAFFNLEEYFEADLYTIFDGIMNKGMHELFRYSENSIQKFEYSLEDKINMSLDDLRLNTGLPEIKKRIIRIFYVYFKIIDPEYFDIVCNQIEPDVFLFRWILCLLNREFNLKDCLYIWDSLFSMELFEEINLDEDDINIRYDLNFIDFICLAMILSLKDEVIKNKDDQCLLLGKFMLFSRKVNPNEIVKKAVQIRFKILKKLKFSE